MFPGFKKVQLLDQKEDFFSNQSNGHHSALITATFLCLGLGRKLHLATPHIVGVSRRQQCATTYDYSNHFSNKNDNALTNTGEDF